MIVGKRFPGDENPILMGIQRDRSGQMIGHLFEFAKIRYFRAIQFVGVDTELAKKLRGKEWFDHRVLQEAHDIIAANFRFRFDPGGQMILPFEDMSYKEYLAISWIKFFIEEAKELAEYDITAKMILTAFGYENTEIGLQAEKNLEIILQERYEIPGFE